VNTRDHDASSMKPQNRPSLPSSSSGPSSSTTHPTLPNELIYNILKRLAEDKPSLAKCMRVSSTFNEITGPILYAKFVIDGSGTTPYDATKWLPVRARLSRSPLENIELIKNVIILSQTSTERMTGLYKRQHTVDTLRLPISDLNGPYVPRHLDGISKSPQHRCVLVDRFNPKKLVVYNSRIHTEDNIVLGPEKLRAMVFLISPALSAYTNASSYHYPLDRSKIKKIVHIVWPGNTLGECGPVAPAQNPDATTSGFMGYFSKGLRSSVVNYAQLEDLVVVNGGQLHHSKLAMGEGSSRQDRDAKFEKIILDAVVRLGKPKAKDQQGHFTLSYGARTINIVFVSLREYFKTYDWSGEFTAEEARPWLETSEEED
jgi:hypothetical protein